MNKCLAFLCCWIHIGFAYSCPGGDSSAISQKTVLIAKIRLLIADSLKLDVGDDFYTRTAENDSMFTYLYVSSRDTIRKMTPGAYIYFGNRPSEAKAKADSFEKAGMDVMVYRTAGTSSAFINKRLLGYDDLSLAFILIHEGVHRHLRRNKSEIPYAYEEALADVIANSFCGWYAGAGIRDYIGFAYLNETIYRQINKCSKGKISKGKCERKLRKEMKHATAFQRDRFDYPVNNAFLLRYSSYAGKYFQLRELYQEMKNPHAFLSEMLKLPADPRKCDAIISEMMKRY